MRVPENHSLETTSFQHPQSWTSGYSFNTCPIGFWDHVPVTSLGSVAYFPLPPPTGPSDLPTTYCSLAVVSLVKLIRNSF